MVAPSTAVMAPMAATNCNGVAWKSVTPSTEGAHGSVAPGRAGHIRPTR